MSSVISNNLSLKCQRCTPFGCKDIGIGIFDFVTKTQILWHNNIICFSYNLPNFDPERRNIQKPNQKRTYLQSTITANFKRIEF